MLRNFHSNSQMKIFNWRLLRKDESSNSVGPHTEDRFFTRPKKFMSFVLFLSRLCFFSFQISSEPKNMRMELLFFNSKKNDVFKLCSHPGLQMQIASKQKCRTQRPARSMRQKKGRCVSNFENHKYLQYFFYKKCMIFFKNKLWKGKVWWYQHRNSKRRLQKYLFYWKVKRNIRFTIFQINALKLGGKTPPNHPKFIGYIKFSKIQKLTLFCSINKYLNLKCTCSYLR